MQLEAAIKLSQILRAAVNQLAGKIFSGLQSSMPERAYSRVYTHDRFLGCAPLDTTTGGTKGNRRTW